MKTFDQYLNEEVIKLNKTEISAYTKDIKKIIDEWFNEIINYNSYFDNKSGYRVFSVPDLKMVKNQKNINYVFDKLLDAYINSKIDDANFALETKKIKENQYDGYLDMLAYKQLASDIELSTHNFKNR